MFKESTVHQQKPDQKFLDTSARYISMALENVLSLIPLQGNASYGWYIVARNLGLQQRPIESMWKSFNSASRAA